MAVPKRRTSHSKKNMRRSHHALAPTVTAKCPRCGATVLTHAVCENCGHYRGKQIVNKEEKAQ